jgi:steroid 5-alpha reductase family enzyme
MLEILPLLYKIILRIFIYMTLFYSLSLIIKRTDIVDIGWGLGFMLVSLISLFSQDYLTDRTILVFFLVLFWGLRLASHIYSRNKGSEEDYRYQQFKKDWGDTFYIRSYFQIFLLQGLFMLIVSLPIIFIAQFSSSPLNYIDLIGLFIWIAGFLVESTADTQLKEFIKLKKKGETKTRFANIGLWKYSRHPNYFGEIFQWWGIGIIALPVTFGYISLIGPLFISYLIIFVSGIPLLEKKFEKDPEWDKYTKRTRKLLPLPKHR